MDGGWLSGEDEEETRWAGGGGEDLMDGWDRARVRLIYIADEFRLGDIWSLRFKSDGQEK